MKSARELKLEAVLRRALREMDDLPHPPECACSDEVKIDPDTGEIDVIESQEKCDCWMAEAATVLNPASEQTITMSKFEGNRWEGEECGECKHSSVYHTNNGPCTKVNCPCMKHVPTGIPNTSAR